MFLSFANDFVVVFLTLKSEKMMRRITLNIPENKFAFFLRLVRSLNFVQIESDTTLEEKPTKIMINYDLNCYYEKLKGR